ncbi:hypothetical protein CYMTET_48614 [Cymbomonas tetramitiformis]|uniref:Tex-like central region domain-containing protein n=1 Tax=Cymbomonas tetramitiformis TaxID=36881 RepID=A0AAE0EVE3_9CHLO|nr:hypothetical protein CYMTET_48614 [Cymbomonas tetramitiformis]
MCAGDDVRHIPFIAMYRKEYVSPLLRGRREELDELSDMLPSRKIRRWDLLWAVYDCDRRYTLLERRKRNLREILVEVEKTAPAALDDEVLSCIGALEVPHITQEGCDDVEAKLRLYFPEEVNSGRDTISGGQKRAQRTSHHHLLKKAGLGELAEKMGMSAQKLGENLNELGYKMHEPVDFPTPPEEVAEEFIRNDFPNVDSVLKATRAMVASEIAAEPNVRAWVRDNFRQLARISTEPTTQGMDVLDPFHPLGVVKRLKRKPLKAFVDDNFLKILQGKKKGLLTYSLSVEDNVREELIQEAFTAYMSDGVSLSAVAWNEQRRQALSLAIEQMLFPILIRETLQTLEVEAKDWLSMQIGDALWQHVSVAPWRARVQGDLVPAASPPHQLLRRNVGPACCSPAAWRRSNGHQAALLSHAADPAATKLLFSRMPWI